MCLTSFEIFLIYLFVFVCFVRLLVSLPMFVCVGVCAFACQVLGVFLTEVSMISSMIELHAFFLEDEVENPLQHQRLPAPSASPSSAAASVSNSSSPSSRQNGGEVELGHRSTNQQVTSTSVGFSNC